MNNTELTYQGVDKPGILEFLSLVAEYNGRPAFTPTRYRNLIGLATTNKANLNIIVKTHTLADHEEKPSSTACEEYDAIPHSRR